jgi:hypothetical protein
VKKAVTKSEAATATQPTGAKPLTRAQLRDQRARQRAEKLFPVYLPQTEEEKRIHEAFLKKYPPSGTLADLGLELKDLLKVL